MAKKYIYTKLEFYENYLKRILNERRDFKLTLTNYTRVINFDDLKIVFNYTGKEDIRGMRMVNSVRNDAKIFENKKIEIGNIDFFRLLAPPPMSIITKIDLNSAYWKMALLMNVITEKTDLLLKELYEDPKELKKARLRALGSLASRKTVKEYEDGELINEEIIIYPLRNLYLKVCEKVDNLMTLASEKIPGVFYYYWDCFFCEKKYIEELKDFILNYGFSSSEQDTNMELIQIGSNYYLLTETDDKMYLIKDTDAYLLRNMQKFMR